MARVSEWLLEKSLKLDDKLRFRDFRVHRTVGGRLQKLEIDRHTLPCLVLPCLICALMFLASPSPDRILISIGCVVIVAAILVWFMRRSARGNWPVQADAVAQCVIVLLAAGLVWLLGKDQYQPHGIYRHIFVAAAVILAITLLLASLLAGFIFRRMHAMNRSYPGQTCYGEYLQRTELFASRGPAPAVTIGTVFTSLVTSLLRSPLTLLTIPAIVALISPTAYMLRLSMAAFLICFLGLFFAALNERVGAMWTLMQSIFFKGGALIVSIVVIILGLARLFGNTYVTPVFDTAAWFTLGITLASVYLLSWWYDYWSSRLMADQIIVLLDPAARGRARVDYDIDPLCVATSVPPDRRFVQIHGSGRLMAFRDNTTIKDYTGPVFQAYEQSDFLGLLALAGAPGGKAKPTVAQIRSRIWNFHSVLALVLVLLISAEAYHLHKGKQDPEVRVTQSADGLSLANLLSNQSENSAGRTLIVIAGSGGGTRAALYTASVLEGIASLGKANDIILASGVSGGGAALAYFASNQDLLTSPDASVRKQAWTQYFEIMKKPYIRDVLDRGTEWRMAGPGRLGILLKESFKEHWRLRNDRNRLSQITNMGLIFNTSLAGHVRRPDKVSGLLEEAEPSFRKQTKSTLAGGRLLLTNLFLHDLTAQPLEPQDPDDPSSCVPEVPVILHDNALRLEEAAALNANFPPVFSNAAIDVDDQVRYWVTDGGAVDNRGMEMMLYALRLALKEMPKEKRPRLLIIAADASALSDTYSQNRGVSSLAGAGTHFASHLNSELLSEIRDLYGDQSMVQFAYVMMPNHLRESGSFGTHWMLQPWIRVRNGSDRHSDAVTINGDEMIEVLRALHTASAEKDLSPKARKVFEWTHNDFGHRDGWDKVIDVLRNNNFPQPQLRKCNPSVSGGGK